jgi:uncharacterized membrane protein YdjX (TVP38/TMEM64 family)
MGAVDALCGTQLRRLLDQLERRGFVTVLCARLAPGIPATGLHYAAGLARVRLRHFVPALALGGAPRVAAYTTIGAAGGDASSPVVLALLAALALLGAGGAALAWRLRPRVAAP